MILIEDNKRIDWNPIRMEYIAGGVSYRKLCEKYNVSLMVLKTRAKKENWVGLREEAEHKATISATQKIADAVSDNATIAADLKKQLLLRLKRIESKYPFDATEVRTKKGESTAIFRIRDLTAAYKDLTEDMTLTNANNDLLNSLMELDRQYSSSS